MRRTARTRRSIKLVDTAQEDGIAVLVAHAYFNAIVGRTLREARLATVRWPPSGEVLERGRLRARGLSAPGAAANKRQVNAAKNMFTSRSRRIAKDRFVVFGAKCVQACGDRCFAAHRLFGIYARCDREGGIARRPMLSFFRFLQEAAVGGDERRALFESRGCRARSGVVRRAAEVECR